jgi:methionyl-tRNA formyltransferase
MAGESTTGVTIMHMDEGLDTGAIVVQAEQEITADDTTLSLTARLAELGAETLLEALPAWLAGEIQAQAQEDALATYCRPLKKEDGRLDWTRPALHLERQVRACDPWPGAYTTWQGQRLKVLRARPVEEWHGAGPPGQVVALEPGLGVQTGQGLLELLEVQLAGKKPMTAQVFARGQRHLPGGTLGT